MLSSKPIKIYRRSVREILTLIMYNKKLLKDIIKTRNTIRKKYKALKSGRIEEEMKLEDTFKAITKPLKELVKRAKNEPSDTIKSELVQPKYLEEEVCDENPEHFETPISHKQSSIEKSSSRRQILSRYTPLPIQYIDREPIQGPIADYLQLYSTQSPDVDSRYGLRNNKYGEWKIGNSNVEISEDGIKIHGKTYNYAPGLLELLVMKDPNRKKITDEDLQNYKSILLDTSAHKRGYDTRKQTQGNAGVKYKTIIKDLLNSKRGGGLMQVIDKNINHVYWNDPNELVDRLRLLIATQQAGHNNHNNEIVSIIEELKEADIIE